MTGKTGYRVWNFCMVDVVPGIIGETPQFYIQVLGGAPRRIRKKSKSFRVFLSKKEAEDHLAEFSGEGRALAIQHAQRADAALYFAALNALEGELLADGTLRSDRLAATITAVLKPVRDILARPIDARVINPDTGKTTQELKP